MLEVVGAEGYERTSVQAVLDCAGVYRQAFYDHFRDKDECFLQAYDMGVERVGARILSTAAEETTWTAQLRVGLGALLDYLDSEPGIAKALIVEVHAAGPTALAKRTMAMQRLTGFFEQAGDTDAAPPIAGEGVVAGINAVIHSRLATGSRGGFRQLLPEFVYFAVLPYYGAAAASAAMQRT